MSRLRMLQVWMATVMLSTGLAVVPVWLRAAPRPLREGLAIPCAALSTWRGTSPRSLRSCLRAERR